MEPSRQTWSSYGPTVPVGALVLGTLYIVKKIRCSFAVALGEPIAAGGRRSLQEAAGMYFHKRHQRLR